jgi:hypothetical protein
MLPAPASALSRAGSVVSVILAAALLTLAFWSPLWMGGGLVGSDIYAYYFPQKAYFADSLRAGTLPLWNNQVGFGYPQLAESQTGVFYPLHWLLYTWLPLNTAYSASMIVHYVLAFIFAGMYARRIGLTRLGAALAGLVYTYGWFPPRVCLEWAITGGTWLPLALWCAESFLNSRFWRYPLLLTSVLGLQMLAGHFALAFITQLTLALYIPLRLWPFSTELPAETIANRRTLFVCSGIAICGAFLVAAVQLLPTWELKQQSQRREVTTEHDPGYGYIPPKYLTQVFVPWLWYADESTFNESLIPGGSRTNRVEAHLYFGIAPFLLAIWGAWDTCRGRIRCLQVWMILGLFSLIYSTGCLLPITKYLPGFSFFEGPGRFGIVTTLAAGLLAGSGLTQLDQSIPAAFRWFCAYILTPLAGRIGAGGAGFARFVVVSGIFGVTILDLHGVSRQVTYAFLVSDPPTNRLPSSPLREFFSRQQQPSRIFSAAKNLPSLLGVATIPIYLGLGPEQYFDPQLALPQPLPFATSPTDEQLDWFHRHGVTHFLSFGSADENQWQGPLVWEGADPFLNQALGRSLDSRFFVYELDGSRQRVSWLGEANPAQTATITEYHANQVTISADSPAGGTLLLTDLAYPGWHATLDGLPVAPNVSERIWRTCEIPPGKHTLIWTYRPTSLYLAVKISLFSVLFLLFVGHVRYWHPQLADRIKGKIVGSSQSTPAG